LDVVEAIIGRLIEIMAAAACEIWSRISRRSCHTLEKAFVGNAPRNGD
jgi:hypothetical protein